MGFHFFAHLLFDRPADERSAFARRE